MPSIRVKGQAYSSLDDPEKTDEGTQDDADHERSQQLRHQLSMPVVLAVNQGNTPASPEPPIPLRRQRASTVASRIHSHVIRSSRPIPNFGLPASPGATNIAPISPATQTASPSHGYQDFNNMRLVEGQQAIVRMPSNSDAGIIEHSINISDYGEGDRNGHHHDDVVEHLDVIDPQIGTVSNLTNAANSILIPPSSWYSRKPIVFLPTSPRRTKGERAEDFEDSLDRHVDDVLRRPSKIRRTLLGVWSFLKTPMGILTGIYGFLVVFWGAAIVIFLAKIINLHNANTQGFWVEVSSQVETGLFTVTSIGLIPSRVLDTYRVFKIWRYKKKTMKLRAKAGLPQLFDVDDLPDPIYDPNYVHVLTEGEQYDLHRQQRKFQHSQTWYRAHGTETHRAFPINMALWICFLNDGNSIFQIFLCGTMWGLNRFERPAWSTGILIPASFLCGIGAAVLIWRGGERTKRVEEVRERLRAALSEKNVFASPQNVTLGHPSQSNSQGSPMILHSSLRRTDAREPVPSIIIDEHMTVPLREVTPNKT